MSGGMELVGVALLAVLVPSVAVAFRIPASPSRRWLAVALSIAIPIVGLVLAMIAARIRGTGQVELDLAPNELPPATPDPEEVERVGELPALLDRLLSADPDERLAGLVTVSHRADRESISLLRWIIKHGDPDAVLDAALTLEELELRWERELEDARDELERAPRADRAVRAARIALRGMTEGLVEAAAIPMLADGVRAQLERAESMELDEQLEVSLAATRAELELAAGRPAVALEVLDAVRSALFRSGQQLSPELASLRGRARFAARQDASRQVGFTVFSDERPDVRAIAATS